MLQPARLRPAPKAAEGEGRARGRAARQNASKEPPAKPDPAKRARETGTWASKADKIAGGDSRNVLKDS